MTSTITGLPDRYRPLDELGPAESTATGVIHCWRAKDRILNRDVAIRVHTPGGPAAHDWITRALTAGGLATPALAMVYDASEGTGDPQAPGGAAYVVNEWIEGQTLAERLAQGPMPEREARTVLRRLAEGVAEAHRVGLAVGGLAPHSVVLRPNGLVGVRAVPAATGTFQGDIAALGELLEYCLTGRRPGGATAGPERQPSLPPDLSALVRRARSTEPGAGLSSVAAMAALLAERPRAGELLRGDETDSGWLRRLRERREEEAGEDPAPTRFVGEPDGPRRLDPRRRPPVPPPAAEADDALLPLEAGFGTDDPAHDPAGGRGAREARGTGGTAARRRVVVVGLPLLALAVVVALAWWIGSSVLSVAGSVDAGLPAPSVPAATSSAVEEAEEAPPTGGAPVAVTGATVFDPFGDGEPENTDDVGLSVDGDPATAWSTLQYRGSARFGNLKEGVGVVYDLGSEQAVGRATLVSTTPGATVEIRTGGDPDGSLDDFPVAASGQLEETTELPFAEPVRTRYVLVWITSLVPSGDGFSASLAEVTLHAAG